ncbi:MAG: Uncharacterized protein G01um10147_160 [Microgenomates group bacterium Gr01-1014_7]|nr:MAG: Uncharacterized protein G01um10147_160 [Microgenomates group bacterium Gr01-1014_7]
MWYIGPVMSKAIPNLRIFLLLAFLSLIIFLFDSFNLLAIPKKAAFYITNPISFGLYQTKINFTRQFNFIYTLRFASQENKALKEQIGQLLSENARLRKDLAETRALVSQTTHLDPSTYNLIPARPVGAGRYLKIDKGLIDGVKLGEAVVFNDNYIGKIIQISEKAANVELLSDPDSKVAAFSQGLEGKAKGVLTGQFGSEILMDKILHGEKVAEGDLVYSEGTEGFLPRGLILGRVAGVLERQTQVFKQAKVKPVFDIRDLELVFVIQDN